MTKDPSIAESYTEHSCQVNVAKYSPSGFYIASAGNKDICCWFIEMMSHEPFFFLFFCLLVQINRAR